MGMGGGERGVMRSDYDTPRGCQRVPDVDKWRILGHCGVYIVLLGCLDV